MSVRDILDMFSRISETMDIPKFQRTKAWNSEDKSMLTDSIKKNIRSEQ